MGDPALCHLWAGAGIGLETTIAQTIAFCLCTGAELAMSNYITKGDVFGWVYDEVQKALGTVFNTELTGEYMIKVLERLIEFIKEHDDL